jgi:3-methyladenine DNA glycosylase Mpg
VTVGKAVPGTRVEDSDGNVGEEEGSQRLSGDTALAAHALRMQTKRLRNMYVRASVFLSMYPCVCMYVYVCLYVRVYVCMSVCMYCMYI